MRLLIIGPPGAGKGTLAEFLCENYGLTHVSTGDMFRKNIKNKTELGQLASSYIEKGLLVPDEVTNAMVERLLTDEIKEGSFLLDGYPRNSAQAATLDGYFAKLGLKLDAVIHLLISDELIIERLAGRRVCSGCGAGYHIKNKAPQVADVCDVCSAPVIQRKDDNEETIKKRLSVYHQETSPLIDYYAAQGLIIDLENVGSIAETNAKAAQVLQEKGLA